MGFLFVGDEHTERGEDDTVTLQADSDEFSEPPDTKKELEQALHKTQSNAYAAGTVKNLLCQWRSFVRFVVKYRIKEWLVSMHTLCLYGQFLAYSFKSASSVRSYMYGIRTLHVLWRVSPPDLKDIEVRLTLRGLNRLMISPVKQAFPITPEIMTDILGFLNLNVRADLNFWGSLLIGFFAMLRKSNLMPDSKLNFDPAKQLTRGHVEF